MKKESIRLSLLALLLLSLSLTGRAQTNQICGCKFDTDAEPKNVTVRFKGSRKGFEPARRGMHIDKLTIVRVTAPASATLYCDDAGGGVKAETLDGSDSVPPVPCSSSPNVPLVVGRRLVDIPRRMNVSREGFPRVITPRRTMLLDARPLLSWASVSGASRYKVSIKSETGETVWSEEAAAKPGEAIQGIEFPGAMTLQKGINYRLVVEAKGRSSEEDDDPDISFSLLADAEGIQKLANGIEQLSMGERAKVFLLASFFAAHDLNYEALQKLKQVPQADEDPETVRLTGELYLKTGLFRLAETQFLRLVNSPLRERDSNEGQVVANTALGKVYESLGNQTKSKQYLDAADRLIEKPDAVPDKIRSSGRQKNRLARRKG
jgi:hypothetical protein